jgi:methylmalonyl-CoA mutase N-terminal domain/subunit
MKERFGAANPKSLMLRFHTQTGGVTLTAQQPDNNVVRVTIQALALPTAEAATLALRTQQIIANESGVANVADPLGGSYLVEALTRDLEREAYQYFDTIDRMGGMVAAIERGYPQREIADSAYKYLEAVERGEKTIVGVSKYATADEQRIPTLYIDESSAERQIARVQALRRERSGDAVKRALDALKRAADAKANSNTNTNTNTTSISLPPNLMPHIIEAVRAYATVGEMCNALRDVWGEWEETPSI